MFRCLDVKFECLLLYRDYIGFHAILLAQGKGNGKPRTKQKKGSDLPPKAERPERKTQ